MLIENEELKITPYDTPWEVACMLINAEYECNTILVGKETRPFFDLPDLRRIGEHIINYCNTEQKEIEDITTMDKCNKKNCPMQFDKVPDNCDIKGCPYRTTDKDDNWEIGSKFLGMILGISEEQRKEWTEKAKNDYYANKED